MKKNEYTKTCNYPADALKIPESPDLERAVLGALMVFPESVADVRGILTSTAFYDPQNARIYDAICKLDDRGIFPDLYQVFEELKGTDISRQYLAVLTQAVGSGVGILNHARILVDKDIQRRGIFTLMEGIATIQEGPEGVMRVISSLERITGDVAPKYRRCDAGYADRPGTPPAGPPAGRMRRNIYRFALYGSYYGRLAGRSAGYPCRTSGDG